MFEKADVGHVVGSYEQAIMQKAFPDKPIRNIPLYIYEDELSDIQKDFSQREDIMYVGGFGHPRMRMRCFGLLRRFSQGT